MYTARCSYHCCGVLVRCEQDSGAATAHLELGNDDDVVSARWQSCEGQATIRDEERSEHNMIRKLAAATYGQAAVHRSGDRDEELLELELQLLAIALRHDRDRGAARRGAARNRTVALNKYGDAARVVLQIGPDSRTSFFCVVYVVTLPYPWTGH